MEEIQWNAAKSTTNCWECRGCNAGTRPLGQKLRWRNNVEDELFFFFVSFFFLFYVSCFSVCSFFKKKNNNNKISSSSTTPGWENGGFPSTSFSRFLIGSLHFVSLFFSWYFTSVSLLCISILISSLLLFSSLHLCDCRPSRRVLFSRLSFLFRFFSVCPFFVFFFIVRWTDRRYDTWGVADWRRGANCRANRRAPNWEPPETSKNQKKKEIQKCSVLFFLFPPSFIFLAVSNAVGCFIDGKTR